LAVIFQPQFEQPDHMLRRSFFRQAYFRLKDRVNELGPARILKGKRATFIPRSMLRK
jgi:hypothetical protein